MNNGALNMVIQVSLEDPDFCSLDGHGEVGQVNCMLVLFLIFSGSSILLLMVAAAFYSPTKMIRVVFSK